MKYGRYDPMITPTSDVYRQHRRGDKYGVDFLIIYVIIIK